MKRKRKFSEADILLHWQQSVAQATAHAARRSSSISSVEYLGAFIGALSARLGVSREAMNAVFLPAAPAAAPPAQATK